MKISILKNSAIKKVLEEGVGERVSALISDETHYYYSQ